MPLTPPKIVNPVAAPKPFSPAYAAAFQCIGAKCEDHCCQGQGWAIPVDRKTYARYQLFPADQLGQAVSVFVKPTHGPVTDSIYAHLSMTESGDCPFCEADRLCGIQKTYGPDLLSATCSSYPRVLNKVDGVLEGSLSLSCPEATRNVLLDEGFLARTGRMESNRFRTDNFLRLARGPGKRGEDFHAVRAAVIGLIGDRARPMGLRVLRVGALCALLQAGARAEDVVRAAQRSDWDDELRALPGNLKVRLDVTRQLSAERAGDKTSGQRFQQTYSKFMRGLGPQGRLERFADAESTLYSKLLEERPYLMENFLVNYIYQKLFPFGRADGLHLRESSVFEEFLLMATLFAWMETLLIGVAAAEGNDFGAADVVKVVQSFCRAVEHYPYVLENVLLTMRTRGLDSLAGMALILRAAE